MTPGIKRLLKAPATQFWGNNVIGSLRRLSSVNDYRKPERISYLNCPGRQPLLNSTVGDVIKKVVKEHGDKESVVVSTPKEIRKSFYQVDMESRYLAAALLQEGLRKGDRVGIWGPNSYEWYLTQLAVMRAGLALVNINPAYTAREIHYCLKKSEMNGIIFAGAFKTSNYYEMLMECLPQLSSSEPGKLRDSEVPHLSCAISMEPDKNGTFHFEDLVRKGMAKEAQNLFEMTEKSVHFDDICNIQFTSGTTGNPKGVALTHHNIVNNAYCVGQRIGLKPDDRICVTVPFFHCYGNVVGILNGLHHGATCVAPGPGFSSITSLETAAKERCTIMYGTPTMHIDMLNAPNFKDFDLSSLRIATTAGAICPVELIKLMKTSYGVENVVSFYGLTETSPVVFQNLPFDTLEQRAYTVGYLSDHIEAKVCDKSGNPVPLGTEGELCIRGYSVMKGYWDDKAKTEESIDDLRWYHTGDLFVMEETGHGRIVGRLKDMIIRGGENISPREVEDFLYTNPKIQEVHVFGIPDPRFDEDVAAWIQLKEGQSMTESELVDFCKGQIAHYKIPRHIRFTESFPKTASGKIQKFKMKENMVQQ